MHGGRLGLLCSVHARPPDRRSERLACSVLFPTKKALQESRRCAGSSSDVLTTGREGPQTRSRPYCLDGAARQAVSTICIKISFPRSSFTSLMWLSVNVKPTYVAPTFARSARHRAPPPACRARPTSPTRDGRRGSARPPHCLPQGPLPELSTPGTRRHFPIPDGRTPTRSRRSPTPPLPTSSPFPSDPTSDAGPRLGTVPALPEQRP